MTAFAPAEYARRLDATRSAMDAAGLDSLLLSDPSNMAWLTGYDGWSFYVHQGVIVPARGDPIWWGRAMDAPGAARTVWMAPDRIRGYADSYVQSTTRHPMQDLAHLLGDLGIRRIGVEMESYAYSARAHEVLSGKVQTVDATGLVNWLRLVKSAAEIDFIRRAARITDHVMQVALSRAAPGVRKNDLIADVMHAAITGVGDDWGDYAAIVPLAPSGPDAAAAHLTWDGRPMQAGEATFFELSGCYRRYHAPLCRTVFLGTPPDEMRRAEAAQIEGIAAGLDAARPGNTAGDIARAFYAVLGRHGISREGRCGYPVGLSYPPDWGERTASIRPEDDTVLQLGMVFHFMPALWMDTWGLETTETILIRDTGAAECLCTAPRALMVKP